MHTVLIFAIIVRTLTDISFKKAMDNTTYDSVSSLWTNIPKLAKNIYIWLGILFGISNFLIWTLSLQHFNLSYAYPFLSISYITIILSGRFLFNEHLDNYKLTGIGFIILGSLFLFLG